MTFMAIKPAGNFSQGFIIGLLFTRWVISKDTILEKKATHKERSFKILLIQLVKSFEVPAAKEMVFKSPLSSDY